MKLLTILVTLLVTVITSCSDQSKITKPINPAIETNFNFDSISKDPKFPGKKVRDRIMMISSEVSRKRPEPEWEITELESPKLVKELEKKFTNRVNDSLNRYVDKVDAVNKIVNGFGKLSAGLLNRDPNIDEEYQKGRSLDVAGLNIIFYGQATYEEQNDLTFKFVPEFGVSVPGVKISDQGLYDAVLAHECYHGYRFLADSDVQKSTHQPNTLSPSEQKWFWRFRAREEMNAYGVGREVLNVATNGKYQERLNQLVQSRKSPDVIHFFDSLTMEDLELIDSTLNKGSNHETMGRCFMYLMDLGAVWLKHNTPSDRRATSEENMYMGFSNNPKY